MKRKADDLPVPERDFCVRLLNMDTCISGVTAMDDDGFANIYLNARQTWERQKKAFSHELQHMIKCDFDRRG